MVLGAACLLAGYVGCVVPVVPGILCSYCALLALLPTSHAPSATKLVAGAAIAVVAVVLDCFVPALGAKKFKCSGWGVFGCMVGTVVGVFFAPLGIVVGPFAGAVAGELVAGKAAHEAIRGGFGALLGFLFGVVLKLSVCALFTWWFAQACLTIAEG